MLVLRVVSCKKHVSVVDYDGNKIKHTLFKYSSISFKPNAQNIGLKRIVQPGSPNIRDGSWETMQPAILLIKEPNTFCKAAMEKEMLHCFYSLMAKNTCISGASVTTLFSKGTMYKNLLFQVSQQKMVILFVQADFQKKGFRGSKSPYISTRKWKW